MGNVDASAVVGPLIVQFTDQGQGAYFYARMVIQNSWVYLVLAALFVGLVGRLFGLAAK